MKLKAIKGFCLGAGKDVHPGDVFEATEQEAAIHLAKGRAVKATNKDAKAAEAEAKAAAEAEAKAAAEAEAKAAAEAEAKE